MLIPFRSTVYSRYIFFHFSSNAQLSVLAAGEQMDKRSTSKPALAALLCMRVMRVRVFCRYVHEISISGVD
jgi:hypothetical protein